MTLDTDKSLKFLASQIQQKLEALENKMTNEQRNQTTSNNWENKYRELENNYTTLQLKFSKLELLFSDLSKSFQNETYELKVKLDEGIRDVKNKTDEMKGKIDHFGQIKAIQQLQDFSSLKIQVQDLSSQTNSLAVHEQARNQDFLALYNQTINQRQSLSNLKVHIEDGFRHQTQYVNQTFSVIERETQKSIDRLTTKIDAGGRYNQTIEELTERLEKKIDQYENTTLKEIANTAQRISKLGEKVALTARPANGHTYSSGEIIQFGNIMTVVGIHDILPFKTSGKFTVKTVGLYQLSVSILSGTNAARFYIYKNSHPYQYTYISSDSNHDLGTSVVILDLAANDTVWVQAEGDLYVDLNGSIFTMIKIK